jgi:hypothetical protein
MGSAGHKRRRITVPLGAHARPIWISGQLGPGPSPSHQSTQGLVAAAASPYMLTHRLLLLARCRSFLSIKSSIGFCTMEMVTHVQRGTVCSGRSLFARDSCGGGGDLHSLPMPQTDSKDGGRIAQKVKSSLHVVGVSPASQTAGRCVSQKSMRWKASKAFPIPSTRSPPSDHALLDL